MSQFALNLSKNLFESDDEFAEKTNDFIERRSFLMNDSVTELGQVAVFTSSRTSLAQKNINREISHISRSTRESEKLVNLSENLPESGEKKSVTQQPSCLSNYLGTIYSILSALAYCGSNILMRMTKHYSPSDHAIVRYVVTAIFMVIVCKYNKLKILGPRKHFKLLVFRGIIGSFSLLSIYFANMLINPSDAMAILHSSIIITAVLSRLFLDEKITISHFVAIILTANGVIFISKPSVLFPRETLESNLTSALNLNATSSNTDASFLESFRPILVSILLLLYQPHVDAFKFIPLFRCAIGIRKLYK